MARAAPMNVFQTSNGDVLVTMHKRQAPQKAEQTILAPTKTKSFLKKAPTRQNREVENDKENIEATTSFKRDKIMMHHQ